MWEKENKHYGLKIFLIILIIALAAGLFVCYMHVKEKESVQDAELLNVYNLHQQEQVAAKQANYDDLYALYQADLDCVKTYLPGIVCWGDAITAGSAGGVSYPDALQYFIDATIVDRYNFYGTLETPELYTRLKVEDWQKFTVDIPVVNMGSGKESSYTVLGRNGAIPYILSEDLIIPSGCDPVQVNFISENGKEVTPLTQGDAGVNNVTIYGVEGKLSLDLESYTSHHRNIYYFTRSNPGGEVTVPAGTEIITAASEMYRDYIPVIFIGTYDWENSQWEDTSVEELIAAQKAIIDHQIANKDRYIIIGLYYMSNRWDYGKTAFEKYEAAMMQEYGNHFINIRKYFCSDGLSDAGITPTKDDTHDIDSGLVPTSLRSAAEPSELNAKGYELLGRVIFDRMDKLGYFTEVKDELGITALEKAEKQAKVS